VHEVSQDLEGIGPVRAYFVDVEDLAGSLPPLPNPSWLGRLGRTVAVVGPGLPYMLGLRRAGVAPLPLTDSSARPAPRPSTSGGERTQDWCALRDSNPEFAK
jgi:hypothetical protein